jgi:hypothetical protein
MTRRTAPAWSEVPRVDGIDRDEFYRSYVVPKRPVVIQNLLAGWRALGWTPDLIREVGRSTELAVKRGNVADGQRDAIALDRYIDALERYETALAAGEDPPSPGYLHDVPLFRFFPDLATHVAPFPVHLLPAWYGRAWSEYTQHFVGPTGSTTPLHFDTLLTNNLFFHLYGRKRFILIPAEQRDLCYPRGWRWLRFDPTAPDYDTYPLAKAVTPIDVFLQPGDVLYIPPGTLHHVRNLSASISFNIDWHTGESAWRGVTSVLRGAPAKNGYYNFLLYLGVRFGVPEKFIFRFYKSYLTYVS